MKSGLVKLNRPLAKTREDQMKMLAAYLRTGRLENDLMIAVMIAIPLFVIGSLVHIFF